MTADDDVAAWIAAGGQVTHCPATGTPANGHLIVRQTRLQETIQTVKQMRERERAIFLAWVRRKYPIEGG
jgi:hypothetical protein